MTTNSLSHIQFKDANAEIQQKVNNYFQSNGLTSKEPSGGVDPCGISLGYDYNYEVDGTLDDVVVTVGYNNYKPKHIVRREILALDSRIADVRVFRFLDDNAFNEMVFEISHEKFIVMIDGEYQQVKLSDYVNYMARNKDFSKRKFPF